MTKALGVIIFQGPPLRHEYYRLTFELLKKTLTRANPHVDKIYLVCNSFNPTVEDLTFLKRLGNGKVTILLEEMASHWACMKMLCKQVVEDDLVLIDSDTLIYNPFPMDEAFDKVGACVHYWEETYGANGCKKYYCQHEEDIGIVSIFDSSGEDLGYPVMEDQRRFAPYFCFLDMKMLRKTSMNFDPDNTHDSMGLLTKEILDRGVKAVRLPDDRGTYNIDKTLIPSITPPPGYYHLRNWNGALHILTSYLNDKESYTRDVTLMPINERCRLLAWVYIINDITCQDPEILAAISKIFLDWGIGDWRGYVSDFRSFHPWIEQL